MALVAANFGARARGGRRIAHAARVPSRDCRRRSGAELERIAPAWAGGARYCTLLHSCIHTARTLCLVLRAAPDDAWAPSDPDDADPDPRHDQPGRCLRART